MKSTPESDQYPKFQKNICIIKIFPIKGIAPLTPKDNNNLPPGGQSVELFKINESLD